MSGSFGGNDLPKSFGSSNAKNSKRSNTIESRNGDSINFRSCAEKLFNKKFEFHKVEHDWTLPPASQVFSSDPWKIRHLQTLKNGLNFQKSRLNDYPIEEWSAHTAKRNPAGDVRWKLRNTVSPEFLTQAWTKFYECACNFNIISENAKNTKEINSLHLCEAPGAFIASLNHFLKLHHQELKWHWIATTLNPYHENNSLSNMICDDRFILHTLRQWDFGLDYSGNLMDWKNSQNLIQKTKNIGEIHLVTADGSIDCMLKPDEQEETVAPLHFCEVITALLALTQGGTFVLKLFTTFEHSTINLMYLLVVCFKAVNIYKPSTSKEGNSEVYAICSGYLGRHLIEDYVEVVTKFYGCPQFESKALFPLEMLPESFLDQIQACAFYFYNRQCEVINDNIYTYENPNQRKDNQIKRYRFAVAHMFLERYELAPITKEDEILNCLSHEETYIHLNPRNHQGTYTERMHLIPVSQQGKLLKLKEELKSLEVTYDLCDNNSIMWMDCAKPLTIPLSFTFGKPVEKIRSSKFVLSWILKFYNKLTEECSDKLEKRDLDPTIKDVFVLQFASLQANERFEDWEKRAVLLLKNELMAMNAGSTLILKNFRVLTQFSAGVLYVLSQTSFREIGFGNDSTIILKCFKNMEEAFGLLECITTEISDAALLCSDNITLSVLGVVPIQNLSLGLFYSCLLKYNNNFLYTRSKEIVAHLSRNIRI